MKTVDLSQYSLKLISGETAKGQKAASSQTVSLADWKGSVLLVVNVASQCGFTPQYKGLQELYEKYRTRGFAILGFPCNQFGAQEPGDEAEIKEFCDLNYKVSFPLFEKIKVNGSEAHPFFEELKEGAPGLLGSNLIKWNFTKFLVDRKGQVVARFAPQTEPKDLEKEIEKLLE